MKISIITATYNCAATVADCMASILIQTHPDIEQIIIDGASTDDTLEIVRRAGTGDQGPGPGDNHYPFTIPPSPSSCRAASHEQSLTGHGFLVPGSRSLVPTIISEPDDGIYDAMNKGIRHATGEVIGILNADDCYADAEVLARVAALFEDPAVMSCYGDLVYVKARETLNVNGEKSMQRQGFHPSLFTVVRSWKAGEFTPRDFYWGWMPPHPTFFVRRSVYERYGAFRLDMGSAADYELMLRFLLKERIAAAYLPHVLVAMRLGGASNASLKNRLRANRMDRRAWEVNGLMPLPWTIFMKPIRKIPQWLVKG